MEKSSNLLKVLKPIRLIRTIMKAFCDMVYLYVNIYIYNVNNINNIFTHIVIYIIYLIPKIKFY